MLTHVLTALTLNIDLEKTHTSLAKPGNSAWLRKGIIIEKYQLSFSKRT